MYIIGLADEARAASLLALTSPCPGQDRQAVRDGGALCIPSRLRTRAYVGIREGTASLTASQDCALNMLFAVMCQVGRQWFGYPWEPSSYAEEKGFSIVIAILNFNSVVRVLE